MTSHERPTELQLAKHTLLYILTLSPSAAKIHADILTSYSPGLLWTTRMSLYLGLAGASMNGYIVGRQRSHQFLAENAHRLPKTHKGWYVYHRHKQLESMKSAISWRGGGSGFVKFSGMAAVFCTMESLLEQELTNGKECWANALISGGLAGGAFAGVARLSLQSSKYAIAMGFGTGFAIGILQDLAAYATGVSVKYPGRLRGGVVGITLALLSGTFIGASVVFTKKALLDMKAKGHDIAQGSHEYLRSPIWWVGMTLTALGEVANFGAYAFVPAILVTPLGAISVVISAVLSAIFLNEKLNFSGMVGCAQCLIGAVIIVLHAPSQSSTNTIPEFFHWVLQPGATFRSFNVLCQLILTAVFIVYSIFIAGILGYLVIYVQPRYAQRSPLVYISISSLGGSYLVLSTQGFGTSLVYSIRNWGTDNQFLQWPIAAIVTPIYYVFFTTATMMSTAFLFQGFPVGSSVNGVSILFGFLTIVGGVALLFQYSLKLQEIAKHAGDTVARMATAGPTASVVGDTVVSDAGLVLAPKSDNRSESELDGTSMVGGLDEVEKYASASRNQGSSTMVGRPVTADAPLNNSSGMTISAASEAIGRNSVGAGGSTSQNGGSTSQNLRNAITIEESPRQPAFRPSLVIDGDGVDERDEVTSISHALVPGLKIIKMMPSLLSGGTRLETLPAHQPPRSFSLGAGAQASTAESDTKSMMSWIRRKSTHSADSGSEVDFHQNSHQRTKAPKQSHSLYEWPSNRGGGSVVTNVSAPLPPKPVNGSVTTDGQRKGSKGSYHISFAPSQDIVQEESLNDDDENIVTGAPREPPLSPKWLSSNGISNGGPTNELGMEAIIPEGLCSSPTDQDAELTPLEKQPAESQL
ncbi:magnesium transporter NIPA-domain-containing protein [Obelidium mucronatum]|nr:magnesium transporter NIPA-domain-containing protein [Obelidium mucronatum]